MPELDFLTSGSATAVDAAAAGLAEAAPEAAGLAAEAAGAAGAPEAAGLAAAEAAGVWAWAAIPARVNKAASKVVFNMVFLQCMATLP
jgi:hypothetical protein